VRTKKKSYTAWVDFPCACCQWSDPHWLGLQLFTLQTRVGGFACFKLTVCKRIKNSNYICLWAFKRRGGGINANWHQQTLPPSPLNPHTYISIKTVKSRVLTWGHSKMPNGAKQVHHRACFGEDLKIKLTKQCMANVLTKFECIHVLNFQFLYPRGCEVTVQAHIHADAIVISSSYLY